MPTRVLNTRKNTALGIRLIIIFTWVLASTAIAVLFAVLRLQSMNQPIADQQNYLQIEAHQIVASSLSDLGMALNFITSQTSVIELVSKPTPTTEKEVANYFLRLSKHIPYLHQMRWIDEQGMERIRVDIDDGQVSMLPKDKLQKKTNRYYFQEARVLPSGDVYLSKLDLNVEHGELEYPYRPTLRFATPIECRSGVRQGIIIINIDMTSVLQSVANLSSENELFMLNNQGTVIASNHTDWLWGPMLGDTKNVFGSHYPKTWKQLRKQGEGTYRNSEGLWNIAKVYAPSTIQGNRFWWQLVRYPQETLERKQWEIIMISMLIWMVLMLPGVLLWYRLYQVEKARQAAEDVILQQRQQLQTHNEDLQEYLDNLEATQAELIKVQRLSALGMTVAGVAHEINTPAGSAMVMVSNLTHQLNRLDEAVQTGLKRSDLVNYVESTRNGLGLLETSLKKISTLVREFRQLAVDRNKNERREFRIEEVTHSLWQILKPLLQQTEKVELNINLDNIPVLNSYPGPLGQILQVLIENAYQHGFEHGSVAGQISVTAEQDDKGWLIHVTDNGKGVEESAVSQLFDPFFTTARHRNNSGLGLYMAHQLAIEYFNSPINVTSKPGEGTTFSLRIPKSHIA